MDQDRKYWPKAGPTGDPEEDRQRKQSVLNRLKRLAKDYHVGQDDLFSGLGGNVKPHKETKLKRDLHTVRVAYAFGLADEIPLWLAKKVGFAHSSAESLEPEPNPLTPPEDTSKAPF